MTVLKAKNIFKAFSGNQVLNDISLSVSTGEVVAVIGPSGSGKSTLLRCINQFEEIDRGEIIVGGDAMVTTDKDGNARYANKAVLRRIRLKIGLVFQNFNLFPHFTVLRNITEAPVNVLKMDKKRAGSVAMELLRKMGLEEKANEYPYQLSGGQQQRVSIARAMALSPEILFFDEPTSALDPELTGEILKVIRSLADEDMTMVIVTHEMMFARDVADRVVFMDGGVVVEEGSPSEVIDNPSKERTRQFLTRFSQQ